MGLTWRGGIIVQGGNQHLIGFSTAPKSGGQPGMEPLGGDY